MTGQRSRARIALGTALAAAAFLIRGIAAASGSGAEEIARVLERIQSAPRHPEGFADLALWLFRQGEPRRALLAAEEAARLHPEAARYQLLVGYLRLQNGQVEGAEAALQRAAELDPGVRVSLADFHLARAWAEYQALLRSGAADPLLAERLRAVATAAELSPELKAMLSLAAGSPESAPAEAAPPIYLEGTDYALVVEMRTQTAHLYRRRGSDVELVRTYPCSTGRNAGPKQRQGDRRTPVGVYVIRDVVPGGKLPDAFGILALPLNYPNAWDRTHGRRGYGIWLHGSDRLGSPLVPRDTQGCILLRNDDLMEIARLAEPMVTPVVVVEELSLFPAGQWAAAVRKQVGGTEVAEAAATAGDRRARLLAAVRGEEYALYVYRDGDTAVREFRDLRGGSAVASEREPIPAPDEWRAKLKVVLPHGDAELVGIAVEEERNPPAVVLETSGPVEAHGFRPQGEARIYVDLPGVWSGLLPWVVRGNGGQVESVRVAGTGARSTRVVIELRAPVREYRLATEGNHTIVSLVP